MNGAALPLIAFVTRCHASRPVWMQSMCNALRIMRRLRVSALGVAGALLLLLYAGAHDARAAEASAAPITLLSIEGPIGPAHADYVARGVLRAGTNGSQLIILQMDTPGGLDTAMRGIIRSILSSPIPVASHVAPGGARAASAGTYILYSSHIAAMAPGTNLGAATPVRIGGPDAKPAGDPSPQPGRHNDSDSVMTHKQVNDAAAYIRGLAQLRGRNAAWAERAVREAVSLPAEEALQMHVIDYLAADVPALAAQLNGKTVTVLGQTKVLHTLGAPVMNALPDWRTSVLAILSNPTIALVLMTVGVYGLIFEFMSPGAVAPGVVGALCLLLGLYGLQLLPVNYSGLALILLALILMISEVFVPSYGVLTAGGIVAFVTGALMLIDTDLPGFGIPLPLIVSVAVASALLVTATATIGLRSRKRQRVPGLDDMVGGIARVEAVALTPGEGWAHVRGERWQVVSDMPLRPGDRVRVIGRSGLVLKVATLPQTGDSAPDKNTGQGD